MNVIPHRRLPLITMLLTATVLTGACQTWAGEAAATDAKPASRAAGDPDVVLLVFDDTGFSDFGSFGSEIQTPNLDAVAAGGLRYNHFETRAICSPTRAALLTGRNNQTVGMPDLTSSRLYSSGGEGDLGMISANAQNLAQALQPRGYDTIAIGKWHLAPDEQDGSPGNNESWPRQRGFDYFYGFTGGYTDQWKPDLVENNAKIPAPTTPGYHVSAGLVDQAIQTLRQGDEEHPDRPAFLYLAMGATHAPIQAPEDYIEKYRSIYDGGWDALRRSRFERMKAIGIIPADTILPERGAGDRRWDALSDNERRAYARFMQAYAGYLDHADAQIGRLIDYLQSSNRYDNTLFIVMSDNGPSPEAGQTGSFGQLYPPNRPTGDFLVEHLSEIGGVAQTNYPRPWAAAGATPFRRYKSWPLSGGVRTPLIVSWPRVIGAHAGEIRNQVIDVIDIAPTIVEAAGAHFDPQFKGADTIPVAGASFRTTMTDAAARDPRDVQFFLLRGNRAIRQGVWRAVAMHRLGTPFEEDRWELHDLSKDFSEAVDLAEQFPEKLEEMKALWFSEAEKYGALPLNEGNPYFARLDRYRDAFDGSDF